MSKSLPEEPIQQKHALHTANATAISVFKRCVAAISCRFQPVRLQLLPPSLHVSISTPEMCGLESASVHGFWPKILDCVNSGTLYWIHCQSASAMYATRKYDVKLTSPEIHRNHSIGDDSASNQYSVVNKIMACIGSVIAFAKIKIYHVVGYQKIIYSPRNRIHTSPHVQIFVCQRFADSVTVSPWTCVCKSMSLQSAHLCSTRAFLLPDAISSRIKTHPTGVYQQPIRFALFEYRNRMQQFSALSNLPAEHNRVQQSTF